MGLKVATLPNYTAPYAQHQKYKTPLATYDLDQTVKGRLIAKLQLTGDSFQLSGAQAKVAKKFLYVDLGGSEMGVDPQKCANPGSGTGYFDRPDLRGYYIEKLVYSAWLQAAGQAPDPNRASQNWSIQSEQPESANQTGSISSSLSYNINGSAGFFGDTVTGNVGGGVTFGTSTSHTITDFTFSQRSDARVLRHEIVMSSARDGTAYRSSSDLADPGSPNLLKAEPKLRELPIQALSNLPIPGQAVWMNDNDAGLAEQLVLHIEINPTYVVIEGAAGDGSLLAAGAAAVFNPAGAAGLAAKALPHYKTIALGGPWQHQVPIDLTLV